MFIFNVTGNVDEKGNLSCPDCHETYVILNKVPNSKYNYTDIFSCREIGVGYFGKYHPWVRNSVIKLSLSPFPYVSKDYKVTEETVYLDEESVNLGIEISNLFLEFFTSTKEKIKMKKDELIFPEEILENLPLMSLVLLFIKNSMIFINGMELPKNPIDLINYLSNISLNYAEISSKLKTDYKRAIYTSSQWYEYGISPMMSILNKCLSKSMLFDEYVNYLLLINRTNKCRCKDAKTNGITTFINQYDPLPEVNTALLNKTIIKYFKDKE